MQSVFMLVFFFSSRRRHTRCLSDWSSDVCSSDLWTAVVVKRYRKLALRRTWRVSLGSVTRKNAEERGPEPRLAVELPILTLNALSKVDFRRPDDRCRHTFRAPDDPLPTSSLTVNEPDRTINSILGLPPVFPANGQPRAGHLGRAGGL